MWLVAAAFAAGCWLMRSRSPIERDRIPTVVVKLGGSALTIKAERHVLRPDAIQSCARQLRDGIDAGVRVLLVHGAGSFGHFEAKEYGISKGRHHPEWRGGVAGARGGGPRGHQLGGGGAGAGGGPAVGVGSFPDGARYGGGLGGVIRVGGGVGGGGGGGG
eukprot:TRINITY_DN48593_c0_g1_i1.p1 TRINITY_DN48593_c0_g1~~TRINITY_DN48593_c0_g1_i1.p1  ORF type:complete len:161 (+),score=7.96 TRINITY_DN48593_c0_g1_i1:132-614(+)